MGVPGAVGIAVIAFLPDDEVGAGSADGVEGREPEVAAIDHEGEVAIDGEVQLLEFEHEHEQALALVVEVVGVADVDRPAVFAMHADSTICQARHSAYQRSWPTSSMARITRSCSSCSPACQVRNRQRMMP
jgi:hypothetical protein